MGVRIQGRSAAARQQQQRGFGGSRAKSAGTQQQHGRHRHFNPTCQLDNSGKQQQEEQQQAEGGRQRQPGAALLQQAAKAAAGAAAAAVLALSSLAPPPAEAVLNNPPAPVARTADVALRRSIPAFNADVAKVQSKLESIGFKLRIPQRKPWSSMADEAASAAALAAEPKLMLAGVLPADVATAQQLVADIQEQLDKLARAIEVKDPDRTSVRVANALEKVAALELLQAPGLPYQLPRQLAGYPALAGRAIVELTVEKASGEAVFVDPNSDAGPQKRATLQLVLDGYSAPITAGNLAASIQAGLYNNTPLSVNGVSVLAGTQPAGPEIDEVDLLLGTATDSTSSSTSAAAVPAGNGGGNGGGGARVAPAALPLEILPAGDFEPLYRLPLDVRSGELPVLPLSIYGSVAMAHLSGNSNGYVSGTQWFIYKFERQQAGLAGLSFDEGEFGVCGYIVKGLDAVGKLEEGDRLVSAKLVSGADKLVLPS